MQSLIQVACSPNRIDAIHDKKNKILNLSKLNIGTLLRISDSTKLTDEELRDALEVDTDADIISLFKKLISYDCFMGEGFKLTLQELQSIQFEKFSDTVQRSFLNLMLMLTTDQAHPMICTLLDRIRSVNYGNQYSQYVDSSVLHEINPLIYCCIHGKFDLVKLLVEQYNANLEHLSYVDTTPIMFSAQAGHHEITKYLFNRGAKLAIATKHIQDYASAESMQLIKTLQLQTQDQTKNSTDEKSNQDQNSTDEKSNQFQESDIVKELHQLKIDYEKIKAENDFMKLNYETIINLIENNSSK